MSGLSARKWVWILAAGNSSAGPLERVQHRAAFASLGSGGENGAEKLLFAFDEKDWVRRELEAILRRNDAVGPGENPPVLGLLENIRRCRTIGIVSAGAIGQTAVPQKDGTWKIFISYTQTELLLRLFCNANPRRRPAQVR
jgi:hypothetical protein